MRRLLAALLGLMGAPSAFAQGAYPTIPYTSIQPTDSILLEGTRFTLPVYTTLPIIAQWIAAHGGSGSLTVGSTPITGGTSGYCLTNNAGVLGNTSCGGGGGGTPGGSSGQVQYNNLGAFGGFTVSGDGTLNTSTGALTVTKTSGTSFGALATITPGGGVSAALQQATGLSGGFYTGAQVSSAVNTALPSVPTYSLYGGSGGAGVAQAVTVGSGLSLSAGTLTATGGGGGGGSVGFYSQSVTPTGTNTFPALTNSYTTGSAGVAIMNVNGIIYTDHDASPAFSVSGTTITWSAANAGFSVATTDAATISYTGAPGSLIVGTTSISGGSNGDCLKISTGVLGSAACGGSATITANSTATSGFSANQLAYSDGSKIQAATLGSGLSLAGGTLSVTAGGGNVSNSGTPTNGQLAQWISSSQIQGVTTLPTAAMPALTGDVTNSAGALATVVGAIGGKSVSLGAALTTTGAGAPTLAFPASSYTYTYPSATSTLGALSVAQSWSANQTFGTGNLIINGGSSTAGVATVTAGGVVSSVGFAASSDVQTGTDNTKPVTSSALSGSAARQSVSPSAGSVTINWQSGYNATMTLAANLTTLTLSNPVDGQTYAIDFVQGGSGSYTVSWPSSVIWGTAGAPTLSTTVGYYDHVVLTYNSTLSKYMATVALGYH